MTLGLDLGDLYADTLTLRRLWMIVRHLPQTSELQRVLRRIRRDSGETDPVSIEDLPPDIYTQTEWLLIAVHDELVKLRHITLQTHSRKRLPDPDFLPRPGALSKRRRTLNAWFGAAGVFTEST